MVFGRMMQAGGMWDERPMPTADPYAALRAKPRSGTQRAIGILSEFLAGMNGGHSGYAEGVQRDRDQNLQLDRGILAQQLEQQQWQGREDYKRAHPEPITVGNVRGIEDPETHAFTPTYTAPASDPAALTIARAAGLTPGTPEWKAALTAAIPGYSNTQPVIDARTAAQRGLAAFRGAQSAALKARPTYAQAHPKPAAAKAIKPPAGFILD